MITAEQTETTWLTHPLVDRYIHQWLTIGPLANPVTDLAQFAGENLKAQIVQQLHNADSGVDQQPLELATTQPYGAGDPLTWQMTRCDVDHFVDHTDFYHTCHHLQSWAYAVIDSPTAQTIPCTLTTNGPADLWINEQHVHRQTHFAHQIPQSVSFECALEVGQNHLLVRFEGVAIRECPNVMALQIDGADLTVQIPTTIQPLETRQAVDAILANARLDRDIFVHDDSPTVRWPVNAPCTRNLCLRIQAPNGQIYGEQHLEGMGERIDQTALGKAYQYNEGSYNIVLMPHPDEYYLHGLKVKREIPISTIRTQYSGEPYSTIQERRIQALRDAGNRKDGLYPEIAKMALEAWPQVKTEPILASIDKANRRADCSDFGMVGLLGMVGRFWDHPNFPDELREPLHACILNFKYWIDEPGDDAMCYWSENHQILFHTCEIIAGRLFEDEQFSNSGMSGAEHLEKGERMALAWLQKRANGGFREWDSNTYFEEDVLALTHLVDFAASDDVAELAAIVLDKLFLSLALNSFKGVFGSTHGRSYTPYIKNGHLEPTAGLSRFLWGMGIFNSRILGTVSLACCDNYTFPLIIEQIATDLPDELWSREQHAGELEEWCDQEAGEWAVNKVTYKTPDYMLCSVQDYRPGEAGYQQHIWQATFSPDAVVFVTHPACVSEDNSHRPGFWHGNVTLPRTAQWKDMLVSIHNAPADDWMGFTHAYFPTYAFDRWKIKDNWGIAQVGDGYIALTAANGLELIDSGNNALRELRSAGHQNTWICMMGRKELDGSFHAFTQKILTLDVTLAAQSLHCDTLRGDSIDFGWRGPLLVNEQEQPLSDYKHYDNAYCEADLDAAEMDVRFGEQIMRLQLKGE